MKLLRNCNCLCRLLLLSCLIGLSHGCRTVFLEGDRPFPKNPAFAIEPRTYTEGELTLHSLRTDGVYVRQGWWPPEEAGQQENDGSPYYRFWKNGRMLYRLPFVPALSCEDADVVDSFEGALIGYYDFAETGVVRCFGYAYNRGKFRHVYTKDVMKIEGDMLWIDYPAVRMRGHPHDGKLVRLGYRFVKIDGMTAEPDW
jgi:hypothetical protein